MISRRKLMLLGDIGVGKTSLARRLVFGQFDANYKATIGVSISQYELSGVGPNHDQTMPFAIWDTDGNIGENIFRQTYMLGANACVLVGDATRPQSIDIMLRLAELCAERLPGRAVTCVINKIDLAPDPAKLKLPDRLVTSSLTVVKASARTGENVQEAFAAAASAILRRGV